MPKRPPGLVGQAPEHTRTVGWPDKRRKPKTWPDAPPEAQKRPAGTAAEAQNACRASRGAQSPPETWQTPQMLARARHSSQMKGRTAPKGSKKLALPEAQNADGRPAAQKAGRRRARCPQRHAQEAPDAPKKTGPRGAGPPAAPPKRTAGQHRRPEKLAGQAPEAQNAGRNGAAGRARSSNGQPGG